MLLFFVDKYSFIHNLKCLPSEQQKREIIDNVSNQSKKKVEDSLPTKVEDSLPTKERIRET